MELIHAEQITAEVTGRPHRGPGARTVVAASLVLAIAGATTAFAVSGLGLGRSAAGEVSGVDTSMDDIVAVRGARFPVGVTFDRSYDQIEAQRGASSLTLAGIDVSYDQVERLRSNR